MVFHELPLCTREHRDGAPHPKVLAGVQGTMAKLAEMVGLRQSTADEEEAPAPAPNRLLA